MRNDGNGLFHEYFGGGGAAAEDVEPGAEGAEPQEVPSRRKYSAGTEVSVPAVTGAMADSSSTSTMPMSSSSFLNREVM